MPAQLSFPEFEIAAGPSHRLFFGVLPDRAGAERAARLAWSLHDETGSRGHPPDRACLHISLIGFRLKAPPSPELVAGMSETAATVALAPFAIELDRIMTFRGRPGRLPVVLLGDGAVAALTLLHLTLDAQLRSFGFDYRMRSKFTPHLTLLYGERPVTQRAVPPIRWPAHEFVLVHGLSEPLRHLVLGRWPLRG